MRRGGVLSDGASTSGQSGLGPVPVSARSQAPASGAGLGGFPGYAVHPGFAWHRLCWPTLLGALIGYHPATRRTIDKLHEADMPHVYVMYAVIGAVIGVAVREFGTVVGVVVFGIGGLIRFRSSTDSTRDTVRLIIVTLAGLIAGLGPAAFRRDYHALRFRADLFLRHQPALPHPDRRVCPRGAPPTAPKPIAAL